MENFIRTAVCVSMLSFSILASAATNLDTVGITLLRSIDPTLTGSGVPVAQPEAPGNTNGTAWEVNPAAVGKSVDLFTYISSDGTSSSYPNALGIESGHANSVGVNFYGNTAGAAPDVSHVDNYEAGYFYQSKISLGISIPAKIVNQSFIFESSQTTVNSVYDTYAAQNNVLFISGAGNSGPPSAPATCYNGIGVGAFGGSSSVGPTTDNGRSKPDITAPGSVTSFSTPLVSGAAAILRQAGLRGDGGAGTTTSSVDVRTIKALLLNGAIKPSNWTHTASAPLDTRYGAGILNAFNSYEQLAAGKFSFIESTGSSGDTHPPTGNTNNIPGGKGWDFNSISSSIQQDKVNHYYFDLPSSEANNFTLTATLVWNRQANKTSINNLDLFLYDTSNSNLVATSTSTVDNVEHLYLPQLPAGRYDLQVFKKGGLGTASSSETYALAFEMFSMAMTIEKSGTNVIISWPIEPTGFRLQRASNLNPPVTWNDVGTTPNVVDDQNRVVLGASAEEQYFRLVRP